MLPAAGFGSPPVNAAWMPMPQAAGGLLQTPAQHWPHSASLALQCRSALAGRGFDLPVVRGKKAAATRRRWLCFGKRGGSGSGKGGAQEVGRRHWCCSHAGRIRGLQTDPLGLTRSAIVPDAVP